MKRFGWKIKISQPIFDFVFGRFFIICGRTGCFKKNRQNTNHSYWYSAQYV